MKLLARVSLVLGLTTPLAFSQAKNPIVQHAGNCSVNVAGNNTTASLVCNGLDPKIAEQIQSIVGDTSHNQKAIQKLSKQLQLIQEELSKINQMAEATAPPTGVLTPADDPMPLTCDMPGVPDSMTRIYAGNSMQVASPDHETALLKVDGDMLLSVTSTSVGLLVSAKIYDENQALVVIKDNRFEANKNLGFSPKRPDPHTLIVYNNWDKEVFKIRFLNPKAVRVTGVFYYPGFSYPVVITDDKIIVNGSDFMSLCNASPNYSALIGIHK